VPRESSTLVGRAFRYGLAEKMLLVQKIVLQTVVCPQLLRHFPTRQPIQLDI
jgi:hypothetical protein